MRRRCATFVLAALAAAPAACGGDAGEVASTTTTPAAVEGAAPPASEATPAPEAPAAEPPATTAPATMSREEYIAAADALCLAFTQQTDAYPDPQTPEELAALLEAAIVIAESTSASFAALVPPPEAVAVHQAMRSSLDGSLAHVRDALAHLRAGDYDATGASMDLAVDVGDDSDDAAIAFGMQVCGSEHQYRTP